MRRRFVWSVLLILLVTVCGCRAGRSLKTNIKETVISSKPEDKFSKALDRNKFSEAEQIWLDNQAYFLEKPKAMDEITIAASHVKKRYRSKISAATT
ncbi:MAG TPA: peptidase S1, partial [Desulfovibrio sp.]|nr:peptidase S1 [Desulfovibrio sp.]